MGVYDSTSRLSFRPDLPQAAGDVAFISQSGNNSVELMLHGAARGLRFSKVVSYGNALDLSEADFFDFLATDPETRVVGAYIEGTGDGRRLLEALRRCAQAKPVVILKGGRTGAGSRTAASHTAALAGSGRCGAMLRQGRGGSGDVRRADRHAGGVRFLRTRTASTAKSSNRQKQTGETDNRQQTANSKGRRN
jgi:acyl-CoA synthetase (NDP forming)